MGTLFMANVPYNCSDEELARWVQSSGIEVRRVRVIRDLVSGASPSFAYVDITETMPVADAVQKLNGHNIRERVVKVSEARGGLSAA
jgi:RNA recognition motif-containing protein